MDSSQKQVRWTSRITSGKQPDGKEALRVATYNIQNLHPGVGDPNPDNHDRLDKLAASIINDLRSPHIIALQEVQDSDGPDNTGDTDATKTLQEMVDAIAAQGGPRYAFTDIAPDDNKDGGQPGSNIRNAFLYDPERVSLHEAPKGRHDQHAEIVSGEDGVHLATNPSRIHPDYHCWNDSRKPLIAEFVDRETDESLFVTNVHLTSKRGGPERDKIRAVQAVTIAEYMTELDSKLEAAGQDKNFLVMGDFNSRPHEYAVKLLDDHENMKNLAEDLTEDEYYTYVYRGQRMAIDFIIASNDLSQEQKAKSIKINAGEPKRKSASDHNPVVVDVNLNIAKDQSLGR